MSQRIGTLTSLLCIVLCSLASSGAHVTASEAVRPVASDPIHESFSIDPSIGTLLVPLQIGEKTYQCILDTGCGVTVLDSRLKHHLGPSIGSIGMETSKGKAEAYNAPRARMGALELPKDELVVCLDLNWIREVSGCDIDGILGNRCLRDWIVRFDFDHNRIDIIKPSASEMVCRGDSVQFVIGDGGLMRIMGTIGEYKKVPFVIDTGKSGGSVSLSQDTFESAKRSGDLQVDHMGQWASIDRDNRSSPEGLLSTFAVGPFQHRGLRAMCTGNDSLGLFYFRRYTMTVDFPNERIYFEKGKRYDEPESSIDRSGLHLLRRNGAIVVDSVDSASPAQEAEIRLGDTIVEIQEKKAEQYALFAVRELLCSRETAAVKVTLRRGQQSKKVTLQLRDLTSPLRPQNQQ